MFDVSVEVIYPVHGQVIFERNLYLLLDPDGQSRPNWYPAELFELVDGVIPQGWEFKMNPAEYKEGVGAIWGYRELVQDENHYAGLMERNPDALQVFHNYTSRPQ